MAATHRVIIADDDPETLDAIADVVEQLGVEVVRVASGGELVEHVADQGPFDLLITDVSMPWMSGLQAAHAVRNAAMSVPILVITGRRDGDLEQQVGKLGANTVLLHKPFDAKTLRSTVESLLGPSDAS